jgi:HlyD family secretion protein
MHRTMNTKENPMPSASHDRPAISAFTRMALLCTTTLIALPVAAADPPASAPAGKPTAARASMAVELVRPRQASLADTITAAGSIAAWQEASVSPLANGLRVTRVLKTTGNTVKRGEVMVEFDDETLRAELAQIQANLAEAEAAVAEAAANAQRARQVRESGALSAQQVQQLLTGETTARARQQALREAMRLQRLRIQQARLRAPDDGIVSFRAATLGAVVPAGFEMFRIIRKGRLEWRAEVPAAALARLAPGMAVRVTADGGAPAPGSVRLVSPTVDPATRNALVYVDLPAGSVLKPGMFARGEFTTGGAQAWVLPQAAVLQRDGFHVVARVGSDGRVGFTKVTVGRRQGAQVEVTGGLAPDAAVVASGAAFLAEGDTVRVVGAAK